MTPTTMGSADKKSYKNDGNAAVLRRVPATVGTVLDVGCGAGDNARILKAAGKVVDGITLSASERDEASKFCRGVVIHNLEQGLPAGLSGSYDLVLCSHVLEHICWPNKLLHDIRDRLVPGGLLVVALPNMLFYKNRWKLLAGRFEYEESGLMDNTHFRWYTFASAQRLLASSGFEVVTAEAEGSFPIPFRRSLFSRALTRPVDAWASSAFPGLFGYQMVFTARPQQESTGI
ncbi:MAG: class I SAM-dependent methyltransferase [Terrimicrobiaceae bacterium]